MEAQMSADDIEGMMKRILAFREERDWLKFHNPKDLALSLVLEASEVLELTQWKHGDELVSYLEERRENLGDELSDVLYWLLLLAHEFDIDLVDAFERKMQKNEAKYPVEKARGRSEKYTEL